MPVLPGLVQVVAVACLNIVPDLFFGFPVTGQPDGSGCRLRALDALGMIVGDGGRNFRHALRLFQRVEEPAHGAYAHCAAVAPGAVGMAAGGGLVRRFAVLFIKIGQLFRKEEPAAETAAVAAHRTGTIFAKGNHRVFELLVAVRRIGEQPPGHRHRHHTVIGVVAALVEQREMVIFRVAELIDRAYGIPCKCAYHRFVAFELYLLCNFNAKIGRSFENAKFFVYFLRIATQWKPIYKTNSYSLY